MSRLKDPKGLKVKGLCVYCTKCKFNVTDRCGLTSKRISNCDNVEKHRYKVLVYIPGTEGMSKSKLLDTRDHTEAMKQAIAFREELEKNNYSTKVIASKTTIPKTIVEAMAYYISYLNNETPHEQEHKIRSKGHIDEVERYFKYFIEYLESVGTLPIILPVQKMDKDLVGKLKSFLLETKRFAPKTYNKYIGLMRIFTEFIIDEFEFKIKNPFKGFKPLKVEKRVKTIINNEFHDLLEIIRPENGIETLSTGQKKNRYKPWLKDAILLTLLTGRRREETVTMKFNGVIENEKGEPISIGIEDYKVNRSNGVTKKEGRKTIYVPVISPLKTLLLKLGYTENKGKDMYILAPDETMERRTMMDFMSKSFTHYYKQLNTGKDLKLYDLRKTYISHLYAKHGEKARMITKHSGEDVMMQHYIDDKVVAEIAMDFGMFGL
jgi:integrase